MIHEFMFHLLKFLIWLIGVAVIVYFALPYLGYQLNLNYFNESKVLCQQKLTVCSQNIVNYGTKDMKCNLNCMNSSLITKKR